VLESLGLERALIWFDDLQPVEAAALNRVERAIGVVYRPREERASHYFQASLASQFDGVIFWEETTAVTPLDR
jgi:erythromycin esterase-like protein